MCQSCCSISSDKQKILIVRSMKWQWYIVCMVPSMVPYYYMQMQQRIKHKNEFNWHMKVKERQGVEEKLTDRENGL